LEKEVLDTFDFEMSFYYRYVDDIVAVPTSKIDCIFKSFNSIYSRLQFTIEISHNTINFKLI